YQYDANGNQTQVTIVGGHINADTGEPEDVVTQFTYDAMNQLVQTTDPLGHVALYGYDHLGRQVSVTQVVGQLDSSENEETDDLVTRTTCDLTGNVLTTTDALGRVTLYAYDALGRNTSVTQAYGTTDAVTTSTVYDPAGQVVSSTDA